MKKSSRTLLFLVLTMGLAALALAGCTRKHIVSSPPAQRPAQTVQPAPQPTVVEEKAEIIEETYIVDAPVDETASGPRVREGDLGEEPEATPAAVEATQQEVAAPAVAESVVTEAAVPAAPTPTAAKPEKTTTDVAAPAAAYVSPEDEEVPVDAPVDAPADAPAETPASAAMAEMYFVQVGAFSDLENANGVLSRLIGEGYKGSKLSTTEGGLFRVQAGAFADRAAAEEALHVLMSDFPKGFILKGAVE